MRKSWKRSKYTFGLQKGVKIEYKHHFWNLWRLFIWQFWQYFPHKINFEESNEQNAFFFSVLCGKAGKDQNTVFDYKKGSKSNINMIFEIFGGYLYNNSGNIFRIKSILKDLVSKIHFSLAFYAEKLKNHKIHFLLQKVVKFWI